MQVERDFYRKNMIYFFAKSSGKRA